MKENELGPEAMVCQTINKIVKKSQRHYNVFNHMPWEMPAGYNSDTSESDEELTP